MTPVLLNLLHVHIGVEGRHRDLHLEVRARELHVHGKRVFFPDLVRRGGLGDDLVLTAAQRVHNGLQKVVGDVELVDKLEDKDSLLPFIDNLSKDNLFSHIVPVSALKDIGVENLVRLIHEQLPEGGHLYPEDQVTDISEKFLASEIVRENCINRLGDELPYRITVSIERFNQLKDIIHIDSVIYVEKQSQKGMLIGQSGSMLKSIGTASRKELEKLLDSKVMLKTWVKVKNNWSDNESLLPSMGYDIDK